MNIKFWKQGGGFVLIENIWHMESCIDFIRFYTIDGTEYGIRPIESDDGIHYAYLQKYEEINRKESHVVSKVKIQGWMAVNDLEKCLRNCHSEEKND